MIVSAWDLWMTFFVGAFAGVLGCQLVRTWRILSAARRQSDINAAMRRHPAGKDLDND